MMERIAEASPRFKARMAGVFQLLEAITATSGQVLILGKLVVDGDAAATAANILGHTQLFWLGFASSLIGVVCHIVWALLMYQLLKPVNRTVSLLAAFVILVGSALQAIAALLYLAPRYILQGGGSLSSFTTQQLQALAQVFLHLNGRAFNVYLVFFGLWLLLIGYLIFKSTFLPRFLGVLVAISGVAWMMYLYPPITIPLYPYIATASAIGEIPLELWLIVMAVNDQRWKEKAAAMGDI
jgi:hypothetical protein